MYVQNYHDLKYVQNYHDLKQVQNYHDLKYVQLSWSWICIKLSSF